MELLLDQKKKLSHLLLVQVRKNDNESLQMIYLENIEIRTPIVTYLNVPD